MANLKSLSVTALLKLRDEIDKTLRSRRAELEQQLYQLGKEQVGHNRRSKGKKVAPKYRSLSNPELVWSGRGGRAKWLTEEMKATKKPIDAFLIR